MVSTLSGLNFNLYRERLWIQKLLHQYTDIPLQSTSHPSLFYRNVAVHAFIHTSSTLWSWPLPLVTTEGALTTQSVTYDEHVEQLWHIHVHMLWKKWKLRLTVPRASDWANTVAGNRFLVSFCIASCKNYLSIALSVLQQLEVIHKTQTTLQQISAMAVRSNRRNFPEQTLTNWECPLSSGFQYMLKKFLQ